MHLETFRINRFRNLAKLELRLEPGLTVLWGANAQGKTNILEAIYFLATGRSFRTTRDEECIPFDADSGEVAVLDGRMMRGGIRHDIRVAFSRRAKSVRVDDKPLARLTDLWGVLATVLFTPEDLQLVGGGPAGRRQYIDIALSQVDHYYLDALKRYSRALRQRNVLLRNPGAGSPKNRAQIEAYEGPLAEAGGRILIGRRDFLARLAPLAAARHDDLSGRAERLGIRYDHFLNAARNGDAVALESLTEQVATARYADLLSRRRNEDLERQQTLQGPHRDDLALLIDEREARAFASQGQARTVALSLRLAEVDFIRQAIGYPPLLLLDDILSELDPKRLEYLLANLARVEIQAIMTTTDLGPLGSFVSKARTWRVEAGRVVPEDSGTAKEA